MDPNHRREGSAKRKVNHYPTGRFIVKESDVLVLLGPDKALAGLKE